MLIEQGEPASPERVPEGSASFDDLYRAEYAAMVRLAFLLTGSASVAEDLVQESFLRVYWRLPSLQHPRAYLRTTVVNACRAHHRRLRLERTRRPDPLPEAAPPEIAELWSALAVLTARQRAAVVLRYYEDLPEAAVAEVLGCRPGTVKSLTARALARLREVVDR